MTVILVALTILFFLGLDWLVRARKEPARALVAPALAPRTAAHVRLPKGVFFAPSHTWLSMLPSGKVWLGLDDFVARLLDKPEVTLLKRPGATVSRGEPILTLREAGHSLTVRSPIDGEVLELNPDLPRQPELLHEDTFAQGWAYALKPARQSDLKLLLLGEEARSFIGTEFGRLRDVFAGVGGPMSAAALQDGGPPVQGVMKQMSDDVWWRFEREFLDVR